MKSYQHKHNRVLLLSLLFCFALLTASCKTAIYVPEEGDVIKLQAETTVIVPGGTVIITITGIKASGHPMPDNTLVQLAADSGKFLDSEGNKIAAVRLIGGKARAAYQADENFTGESVAVTAQSGSALVNPEQLIITVLSVEITRLYMTAEPLKLPPAGGTTNITVTAYDSQQEVVPGRKIFLETTAGALTPSSPIVTDENGKISTKLETSEPASVTAVYKEISKTIEIDVGINEPPIAGFEFSPRNPLVGDKIYFTSTSTDSDGDIVSHHWAFGDGKESDEVNPTYHYKDKGAKEYQVVLTVTDNGGKKSSVAQTVAFSIEENTPPTADFSFTPENPVVGEDIQFISSSTDEDGTITTYKWNFDDSNDTENNESQLQNPNHSYSKSGEYAVMLTVTDDGEKSNSITKPITIIKKENQPPEADFTFSPINPRSGETVYFNAEASTDPDGDVMTYSWNFGDDTEPTEYIPETTVTHSYEVYEEKKLTVTLTVKDTADNKSTASRPITVLPTPVAKFTFSPAEPELDGTTNSVTVTFDASSSEGKELTYQWFFGDGKKTSNNKKNVVVMYTYKRADDFTVTLTVTDKNENTDTTYMVISIKQP